MWYSSILEKNLIPDFVIRKKIRTLLKQRLKDEDQGCPEKQEETLADLIREMDSSPIAINTKEANDQHYEIPSSFYRLCLGIHMKYSCGYWADDDTTLDESEAGMLKLTCERAEIRNGMNILELGCGWGSLTLFVAKNFPGSLITGVSNSVSQKEYIMRSAEKAGLTNIRVITSDMNIFETEEKFDRVVSVEMFEHMRNYRLLLSKISRFLKDDGKLFIHIFTHRKYAYKFEVKDNSDWISKYFFTGGIMPSDQLLYHFTEDYKSENHWTINGLHYSRTSEAWLENMDSNRKKIIDVFERSYGTEALKWFVYWRIFFMSCSELWKYQNGKEWMVSHYLFSKKTR